MATATVGKQKIDENQFKYLTNLSSGKNPDGSAATPGNMQWAKEQLAKSSYTPAPAVQSKQPTDNYTNALYTVHSNPVPSAPSAPSVEPFQFKAPDPFTYDKYSDPMYLNALQSARTNIAQQQDDTNARLRASGQGKSSYSEQVANQIGAREMGRVETDILPALIDQAYARYVDQANRDFQVQQANYGITRDQQSDAFNRAQLTGRYMDPQAQTYINEIVRLGEAWKTGTPEQQAQYHQKANEYRAALAAMGVDPSLFGADKSTEERIANMGNAGVQTLAAQQFAYQQARDAILDERYKQQFDEDVRRFGLEFALREAMQKHQISADNAQIAISRMNAGTSAFNAQTSRMNADWARDPNNPDNIYRNLQIEQMQNPQGGRAEEYFKSIDDSMFVSPEITTDEFGNQTRTGRVTVNDPDGLERYILSLRLPDEEARKLYYRYGIGDRIQ